MTLVDRVLSWLDQVVAAFQDPDERLEREEYAPEEEERYLPSQAARAVRPMEVLIATPHEYKDARFIVQSLEEGKTVFIRLMEVDDDLGQRILDFVSGAVCLLHGTIELYDGHVLLCAPQTVRIEQGDYEYKVPEMPVFRGINRS